MDDCADDNDDVEKDELNWMDGRKSLIWGVYPEAKAVPLFSFLRPQKLYN